MALTLTIRGHHTVRNAFDQMCLDDEDTGHTRLRTWATREPALAPITNLRDVPTQTRHDPNGILLALVRVARAGDADAYVVIARTLEPRLLHLARRRSPTPEEDSPTSSDLIEQYYAALFETVSGWKDHWSTANMPLNLTHRAFRTVHGDGRAVNARRRTDATMTRLAAEAWDDSRTTRIPVATLDGRARGSRSEIRSDLVSLLAWATREKVITPAESRLLFDTYAGGGTERPGHQARVASSVGISPASHRQRCSRLARRLAAAVRDGAIAEAA